MPFEPVSPLGGFTGLAEPREPERFTDVNPETRPFQETPSVMDAAFRTENTVGSSVASEEVRYTRAAQGEFSAPVKIDPDYDPWADIVDTKYETYADKFALAGNRDHANAIKADIDRETKDRDTIARSGWTGIGASMAAGVLDLPIFLPGGNLIRTAKGGVSLLRTAGSTAVYGTAAAIASETVLHGSQQLRTGEESAMVIGGSTVLAGLLGAGFGKLFSRAEQAAFAARVEKDFTIPGHGEPDHYTPGGVQVDAAPGASAKATSVADIIRQTAEEILPPQVRVQVADSIDIATGGDVKFGISFSNVAKRFFDSPKTRAFHGTNTTFERFDLGKTADGEPGIFFTDNPALAERYATNRNVPGNETDNRVWAEAERQGAVARNEQGGMSVVDRAAMDRIYAQEISEFKKTGVNIIPVDIDSANFKRVSLKGYSWADDDGARLAATAKQARRDGHAGLIIDDFAQPGGEGTVYVAWKSGTVKSAISGDQMFSIKAYHASPHDFDEFDLSKLGTGEGAQEFGHGLYLAESEAVSGVDGQYYKKFLDSHGKAHSYEVSIDVEHKQLLDWDKPLSGQSDHVKQFFKDNPPRPFYRHDLSLMPIEERTGESLLASLADSPAEASEMLRKAGIPGIRYFDGGSRDAGEGTRNIVIFDDKLVKITKKNGEPVTAAERKAAVDQMFDVRKEGAETVAEGRYDPQQNLITISADALDPVGTLSEEAVHALRAMGLFRDKEWKTLEAAARKQGWMESYNVRALYEDIYSGRAKGGEQFAIRDVVNKELADIYDEFGVSNIDELRTLKKQLPLDEKRVDRLGDELDRMDEAEVDRLLAEKYGERWAEDHPDGLPVPIYDSPPAMKAIEDEIQSILAKYKTDDAEYLKYLADELGPKLRQAEKFNTKASKYSVRGEGKTSTGPLDPKLQNLFIEEAITKQYRAFATGTKTFDSAITAIFQRIKDFLERIGNALRGQGFQTADDVFASVRGGDVAGRAAPVQNAQMKAPVVRPLTGKEFFEQHADADPTIFDRIPFLDHRELERELVFPHVKDGKVVGATAIEQSPSDPDVYWSKFTSVDESYRNQGIAKALVQQKLDFVRSEGKLLKLSTRTDDGEKFLDKLYEGVPFVFRDGEPKPPLPGRAALAAGSGRGASVGAAAREAVDNTLKPALGLEKVRVDPLIYLQNSKSEKSRTYIQELAETPLAYKKNAQGMETAPLGSEMGEPGAVESRIKMWQAPLAESVKYLDNAFMQYRKGRDAQMFDRMRTTVGDALSKPEKLDWRQFKEEVSKAARRGDAHEIPEVAQAAKFARDNVFNPLKDRAIAKELLPEDISVETAESYLNRMPNKEKIIARRPEFKGIVEKWLDEVEFRNGVTRAQLSPLLKRLDKLQEAAKKEAAKPKGKIANKNSKPKLPSGLTQEQMYFQAAAVDTRQALEQMLEYDLAFGKNKFKGDAKSAFDGLVVDARRIIDGIKAGDKSATKLALSRASSAADKLEVAAPGGDSILFTQWIRAAERRHKDLLDGTSAVEKSPADIAAEKAAADKAEMTELQEQIEALVLRYEGKTKAEAESAIKAREKAEAGRDPAAKRLRAADKPIIRAARKIAAQVDKEAGETASLADEIIDRWLGTPDGRLPYDAHLNRTTDSNGVTSSARGPLAARTFMIPDELIEDFLENDFEMLMHAYVRTMAPDVELHARFKDVDMKDQLKEIQDDWARINSRATSEKERRSLHAQRDGDLRKLAAIRDRLRGTYKLPDNPDSMLLRTGRVMRSGNYMAMLGGQVASAIPDMGSIVFSHGIMRTFGDGIIPLFRNFSGARMAMGEVKLAGTALDMVLDSRAMNIGEIMDDYGRHSKFERGVQSLTRNFGPVSLMSPWNAAMKQTAGLITMSRIIKASDALRRGVITKPDLERLAASGISPANAKKIAEQFKKHGEKDGGVYLPKTENWDADARAAKEAFRVALAREVDKTIITPGQEKWLWMSTELGKTLGQFKSFSVSANQRLLIAGLQQRDMGTLSGAALMVALGGLVHILKTKAGGRDPGIDWSDNEKTSQFMVNAVDRSGLLGWLMEANAVSEKVTGGQVGLSKLTGRPVSRYASRNAVGSLFGPTFGTMQSIGQVSSSGFTEWKETDTRAARRLIPYQNLFYMRSLFDKAEEGVNSYFGVPKTATRH